MTTLMARLAGLMRRRYLDADLHEELRSHIEALEAEYRARGLSASDAALAAQRDMGGVVYTVERCRDARGFPSIESLWRDVRLGIRSLKRTPGITLAVTATLAIGIGANTAMFTVVNGVLMKPLPYPNAGDLVSVGHRLPVEGDNLPSAPFLYFTYRDQNRAFENIGLWIAGHANVTGVAAPEQVRALAVTAEILPALGVAPILGRTFTRKDDVPGARNTVVLTHGYWQRRFGGDTTILGRTLRVDGEPYEVIGIMPAGFRFLDEPVDIVYPFQLDRNQVALGRYTFRSLARLRPGFTLAEAAADADRMIPLAIDAFPPPPGDSRERFKSTPLRAHLEPLKAEVVGDIGRTLWVLAGALAIVLLIAGANVASLILVRTEGRRQELAVRAALGAGRGRIARELLVESVSLGLVGGVLGIGVAYTAVQVLRLLDPPHLPRLADITVDPWVWLFALCLSVLAGLLFGTLAVIKYAWATSLMEPVVRGGSRSSTRSLDRRRAQTALVVLQVAMAMVLLVCSGLMIRTFTALGHVDPGFKRPEEIQLAHLSITDADAPAPERATRIQQAIVDRFSSMAGVTSVAFADLQPLAGDSVRRNSDTVLLVDGKTYTTGESRQLRRFEFVSPELFRTLGTPLIAGRDLTWDDLYGKRMVALVSDSLARSEWGTPTAALGKRVRASHADPWREIVGVVGNLRDDGMNDRPTPIVYFPALVDRFWGQPTMAFRSVTFIIRSERAGRESFVAELQRALWQVDGNIPLAEARTLEDVYRGSLARTSFALVLLAIASAMGLLLAVIGLYGVIAYAVSQRAPEIGIRLALGAQVQAVVRLFTTEGIVIACAGIGVGLAVSIVITRLMGSLLFGVSAADPLTYLVVTTSLLAATALAAYLPARRTTRIDPSESMRGA